MRFERSSTAPGKLPPVGCVSLMVGGVDKTRSIRPAHALRRTTFYNYWQHDDKDKVCLSTRATSKCRAVTALTSKSLGKYAENLIVLQGDACLYFLSCLCGTEPQKDLVMSDDVLPGRKCWW